MKLQARAVEKPWGRTDIPSAFGGPFPESVGEIWFEHPAADDSGLLVKYIFTSERLSVQVHPDDEQARVRGLPSGKSECWYVLGADLGASLALGLKGAVSSAELCGAALDGSIEDLLEWRPVKAGDFFYVPAGTVHAIGAGIKLLEVQQNSDVTYRLFDYGRPRELHLDDGIAVSRLEKSPPSNVRPSGGPEDVILVNGPHFTLARATTTESVPASLQTKRRWVMPLSGRAESDGESASAGECLLLEPFAPLFLFDSATVLVGAEGSLENRS